MAYGGVQLGAAQALTLLVPARSGSSREPDPSSYKLQASPKFRIIFGVCKVRAAETNDPNHAWFKKN